MASPKTKRPRKKKSSTAEDDAPPAGHNRAGGLAGKQLRSLVDAIERNEEAKKELAEDTKELYANAKATGFDTKILRKCVALRKRDKIDREEEEALIDTYMFALGDGDE